MVTEMENAEVEKQIEDIKKFLNVKERYNQKSFPPPCFIELTGPPLSGKTTTIGHLYDFLRARGFEVFKPQEGAEVIPARLRNSPIFNIRTANYALGILMEQMSDHRYDFVIFDRCIFDAYHWMRHWFEKGELSEEEMKFHQNHYLHKSSNIGLAYIMVCDPEVARGRKKKRALSENPGKTTSSKSQREITERFVSVYEELSPKHNQLHLIDTTTQNIDEVCAIVERETLETFAKIARQARAA
ncbi:MAG TPA: AAA family ATPase [Candidatus Paceibacterota bacterium]